ncbi:MAG: DUF87 domain-containing protein, partial [Bacteroidales bacterium]|nr:DUF87 domain-containing protein [Bacteroidales bacterium]
RLVFLTISVFVMVIVGFSATGSFRFLYQDFWFTSGILLLILLSLIDQPYFSKDSNIFVNGITAGLSLLLVDLGDRDFVFWCFTALISYLCVSSYALMWIRKSEALSENHIVKLFSRINREIGKPECLFSILFLWGIWKQFGAEANEFKALLVFWGLFMIFNIQSISKSIEGIFRETDSDANRETLGRIFGVQSNNTFLVKLFDYKMRRDTARIFDFVSFKYSVDQQTRAGVIVDSYLLDQEQWIKVFASKEISKSFPHLDIDQGRKEDLLYKINDLPTDDLFSSFLGVVTETSSIEKIRFIYNSKVSIEDGSLVEVKLGNKTVLYQIIQGLSIIEKLENRNQSGETIAEAIQLGVWNDEKLVFERFGWVPKINTPVFLAKDTEEKEPKGGEIHIGSIPNTNYPIFLNAKDALSHHMAVLGVTGTGKSIFSRYLIRQYLEDDNVKVICVDFTGEIREKLGDLNPIDTIKSEVTQNVFNEIDSLIREEAKGYKSDQEVVIELKKSIASSIESEIRSFLGSRNKLSILELPEVDTTAGMLLYIRVFFKYLFHIAKSNKDSEQRICVVLEEAHTVIPEWNFSVASNDKASQSVLNSIAQIALQGRKYNVGLLVIAQRTANVSKTILTQCNTIVSFQQFDKTSTEFLANYFGSDIAQSITKLKFRNAVAAGKAFRSGIPLIFEVLELDQN